MSTASEVQNIIDEEAGKIAKIFGQNRNVTLTSEQFNTWMNKVIETVRPATPRTEGVPSSPAGGAGSNTNDRIRRIAEKLGRTSRIEPTEWILSKNEFLENWHRSYKEAVTSTNVPGIAFQRDVLLLPDQQTALNIRPFVNFEPVPDGAETFHWHKLGSVTFSSTPDSTGQNASSQTATRIAGTVARRGAYQTVGFEQGRALPFSLIDSIEATMMRAAIHDEASLVLEQPATELSPDNWIDGDGDTITADDTASVTLEYDGISKAIELLTTEGYTKESLVAFVHPKPYAELIDDAIKTLGLNPYSSDLLASGQIERYLGIRVIPTTAVYTKDNATNDAYRNIVCVSGVALGLAARDQVEIETFRDIKNVETQISGGHYIDAEVIDKGAYVRISTSA